jgi:hypothetical protein
MKLINEVEEDVAASEFGCLSEEELDLIRNEYKNEGL